MNICIWMCTYNVMHLYMSNDASVYLEVLLQILPLGVLSVNTNTE